MKFLLAYTICSAMTGMCNTPTMSPMEFNTWTDCTKAGAIATIKVTNENIEKFNKDKLYVSYFCNEVEREDA
jgi:hypothetical protein|tara:strand:- start:337 stop:552 length:216 start_codon:yes stop_codon:yes gene_type:complete